MAAKVAGNIDPVPQSGPTRSAYSNLGDGNRSAGSTVYISTTAWHLTREGGTTDLVIAGNTYTIQNDDQMLELP